MSVAPDPVGSTLHDVTVVVPVRNAAAVLEECLASVVRSAPREIIVVDGMSTDATLEIARRYTARILSDGGAGLPVARIMGAEAAATQWVALVDADVILPDGALEQLFAEFLAGDFTALQAGLDSIGTGEYWSEALAEHHRSGRSKNWFGLGATIFARDVLLDYGFDRTFASGEDIELRWRLEAAGAKVGVSKCTTAIHRFEGGFSFARQQWLADGRGLARMVKKHPRRGAWLLAMPLAAGLRGAGLSIIRRRLMCLPYYACYAALNYAALVSELLNVRSVKQARHPGRRARR